MLTLKDLSIKHDYYASSSNYYSNDPHQVFNNWPEFMAEYRDADIDMNLIYRWDIHLIDDKAGHKDGNYRMQVIIIGQRKGLYIPVTIERILEIDAPDIVAFLKPHYDKLISIWKPISI